jgi:hypothetical protein
LTAYFTLGLALFSSDSYEDVIRQLTAGFEWGEGWAKSWSPPSKAALFQARKRLGPEVVEGLFRAVARPLGAGRLVGGLRVVAVDGTVLDVADTAANDGFFSRPGSKGAAAAYPQARVVALADCGSRAVFAAGVGGCRDGERGLAGGLFGALGPGMLLVADRGFYSFALWEAAAASGAELCWRATSSMALPRGEALADGSYLSEIYPSAGARRSGRGGRAVRVVEYSVGAGGEPYRLLTTVLDPAAADARALAGAYRERWRIETSFDELKTHQGPPSLVLRSKSPDLVVQEIWAFLCVHFAIRSLMADAACPSGLDPGRLSFTAALKSGRRSTATHPGFSPLGAG